MRRKFGCILCTVKAAGLLPASLASLDELQVLHASSYCHTDEGAKCTAAEHERSSRVVHGLRTVALLDQAHATMPPAQVLHLDNNWFNGTLPPEFAYGFPALQEMRLDYNALTVRARVSLGGAKPACVAASEPQRTAAVCGGSAAALCCASHAPHPLGATLPV